MTASRLPPTHNTAPKAKPSWDQRAPSFARRYLPPAVSKLGKRAAVHLRYRQQLRDARKGYAGHGKDYPQPIVFIAGLPKSGTTWLKKMVSSYPGFHEIMIPEAAAYELAHGGSHDYELPAETFARLEGTLAVLKMHVHGSTHNRELLASAKVPYVVLFRDLRDVAISYYHYVRKTPWHPDYERFRAVPLDEGLRLFASYPLPEYVQWINSWQAPANHGGLTIRYEDLLQDTPGRLAQIADHFGFDTSASRVQEIVEANAFTSLSGGRTQGEENQESFFRKGVAGEWRQAFPPDVRQLYESKIGDFMVEIGYAADPAG